MEPNQPRPKRTMLEAGILIVLILIFLFLRFGPLNRTAANKAESDNTVKSKTTQTLEKNPEKNVSVKKDRQHLMTAKDLIGKTFYKGNASIQFVDDHRLIFDSPDSKTTLLEYSIFDHVIRMKDGASGTVQSDTIRFLPTGFTIGKTTYKLKDD